MVLAETWRQAVKYTVLGVSFLFFLLVLLLLRMLVLTQSDPEVATCDRSDVHYIRLDTRSRSNFAKSLTYKTVSVDVGQGNETALLALHAHIKRSFPAVHGSNLVTREVVANYSLLYEVRGSDPHLPPYMLAAHLDVVPVEDADLWEAPPFSGLTLTRPTPPGGPTGAGDGGAGVAEYVYGRGAIDCKHTLMGMLEALEHMLTQGYRPRRTIYLAFGHDEEVMGTAGAREIGLTLARRGVQPTFILDEGLTVLDGVLKIIEQPVALIGTSEKGFLTVEMTAEAEGGHSSVPPRETAIGQLARAICRLQEHPVPARFGQGPEASMFEAIASKAPMHIRYLLSNLFVFGPVVSWLLAQKPTTDALQRTTTVTTVLEAGRKANVVPPTATATVNHRIHPADTVESVLAHDRRVVNDERIKFRVQYSNEPLPVSPHDSASYAHVRDAILAVFPGVVVAPGLMVGGTDTKHYTHLTDCIYRFSPVYMYPDDVKRFHGRNERIAWENYEKVINFFHHLILNVDREGVVEPAVKTEL